jgi:hypothetical protein
MRVTQVTSGCDRWYRGENAQGLDLLAKLPDNIIEISASGEEGNYLMVCRSCQAKNVTEFGAEINIHFPAPEGLDEPSVFVFPKLVVCLACGFANFTLPETELRQLAERGRSVEHWHGASPKSGFAYIAVTPTQKGKTIWLEPVSDKDYNSLK